jgi:hypothetical protein
LEVNGHFFGKCSLALVLHGTDPSALQVAIPMCARRSSDTPPPLNKLAASNKIRLDRHMY